MDAYATLGVEEGASLAEIDRAYARRRRLHDVAAQPSADARAAARRYHDALDAAYRSLVGTDPPAPAPPGAPDPPPARTRRAPSSSREEWLTVLATLVAAYVLVQLPLALGFGLVGAAVGWLAAIGVVAAALARLRTRRASRSAERAGRL
jgi:hypothetical protein